MKTPPANLPSIPEGWVYIGAENEIDVTGCEDDLLIGYITGNKWLSNTAPANKWTQNWGTPYASPLWHYIAPAGSKIAQLNTGEDCYPALPEGFEYWDEGSTHDFTYPSDDVFIASRGFNSWNSLPVGDGPYRYAIRIGSDIHRASKKEDPKAGLKSILAEWREARFGSKTVEPTHKPLLVSAEKYALLMKENEWLTRENERLKQQIESRNQIIVGFKDSINRVMDF